MVSTTPRNTQDWGVTKYSVFDGILSTKALTFIVYVRLPEWNTRKVSTGSIIYIYILVKEEPYTVPLGMDFQLNLPKPVKKNLK